MEQTTWEDFIEISQQARCKERQNEDPFSAVE